MSFTASCKSRCLALFLCKRSFSAINVPPKAANNKRTTWKRPDLLTMTCWLPDMILNLDGAAAFLSSSPMAGYARLAAVREGLLFLCRQRTRGAIWPAGAVWLSRQLPSAGGLVSVRCAGVVLRLT